MGGGCETTVFKGYATRQIVLPAILVVTTAGVLRSGKAVNTSDLPLGESGVFGMA